MTPVVLEARDVWLDYDSGRPVHALRGVDLGLRRGDFLGVMGPSGSGKSSLLYVLAGLRRPTRGLVTFLGRPWPERAGDAAERRLSSVGFVFQEPLLIPHLTLRENALAASLDPDDARVVTLARRLGMEDLLDEFPARVSAGERQRAGLVRALVNDPVLVLADEPTACLDTANGLNVMRLLAETAREAALVVCSHDRRMLAFADRIRRIEDGRLTAA